MDNYKNKKYKNMRELVLDTETTGLDHENGDRIVEVGIIELNNHVKTGKYFHYYINPERESDVKAEKIHGLSRQFLSDKLKFRDIAEELVEFISDSKIIIHNAKFDVGFLNFELKRCDLEYLNNDNILDTLILARKKYPGQSVSLDTLCRRFGIDITNRKIHGALLDAELLSLVYLELIGGKQTKLNFNNEVDINIDNNSENIINLNENYKNKKFIEIKNITLNKDDHKKHKKFIETIPNNIWSKIIV
jgi:DNA polymerase-3 subunit epsilon